MSQPTHNTDSGATRSSVNRARRILPNAYKPPPKRVLPRRPPTRRARRTFEAGIANVRQSGHHFR